jgi:hypothetical protein
VTIEVVRLLNIIPKTVHRRLKIIACNANCIGRQAYVGRKHLQDLKIDVAFFSGTHQKPHMNYIPSYDICPADHQDGHKVGTAAEFKKGIPQTCVDVSPALLVAAYCLDTLKFSFQLFMNIRKVHTSTET